MSTNGLHLEAVFDRLDPDKEIIDERGGLMDYFHRNNIHSQARRLMDTDRIQAHAPLLAYKIWKAAKLMIMTDGQLNDVVNDYLAGKLEQNSMIERLSRDAGLPAARYRKELLPLVQMGMVEFHPTDNCNNHCPGCIFSQSARVHSETRKIFPYENLKVFETLRPKTMILVGGGEPTVYRDGHYRFTHLVEQLSRIVPQMRFGLVTNGIYKPEPAGWEDRFEFVRISLGAHNSELYRKWKGSSSFDKILRNALDYLNSPMPLVVFNYMMNRDTAEHCIDFARFIYRFVKENAPRYLGKCSIQYRSLIYSPNISRLSGNTLESDGVNILPRQVAAIREKMSRIDLDKQEFDFIIDSTNLEDCLQGTRSHNPKPFDFCGMSLIFGQIRADGNVQPCNVRSDDPVVRLGHLESEDGLIHLAVKQFKVFLKNVDDDLCQPQYCRKCGINKNFTGNQPMVSFFGKTARLKLTENQLAARYDDYLERNSKGIDLFFY